MLKEKTIENFSNSNLLYEKWEQIMNMLHEFPQRYRLYNLYKSYNP